MTQIGLETRLQSLDEFDVIAPRLAEYLLAHIHKFVLCPVMTPADPDSWDGRSGVFNGVRVLACEWRANLPSKFQPYPSGIYLCRADIWAEKPEMMP